MAGETTHLSLLELAARHYAEREAADAIELAGFRREWGVDAFSDDALQVRRLTIDDDAARELSARVGRRVGFNSRGVFHGARRFWLEQRCGACRTPIELELAAVVMQDAPSFDLGGLACVLQRAYLAHDCPPYLIERQLDRLSGPELEALAVTAERDMLRAGELLEQLRKRGAF